MLRIRAMVWILSLLGYKESTYLYFLNSLAAAKITQNFFVGSHRVWHHFNLAQTTRLQRNASKRRRAKGQNSVLQPTIVFNISNLGVCRGGTQFFHAWKCHKENWMMIGSTLMQHTGFYILATHMTFWQDRVRKMQYLESQIAYLDKYAGWSK